MDKYSIITTGGSQYFIEAASIKEGEQIIIFFDEQGKVIGMAPIFNIAIIQLVSI